MKFVFQCGETIPISEVPTVFKNESKIIQTLSSQIENENTDVFEIYLPMKYSAWEELVFFKALNITEIEFYLQQLQFEKLCDLLIHLCNLRFPNDHVVTEHFYQRIQLFEYNVL